MCSTSAWISTPAPNTTPATVLCCSSPGLEVLELVTAPVNSDVLVMDWVRPLRVSQATPPSTYGRTSGKWKRYLSNNGNSHAPDVVDEVLHPCKGKHSALV